MICKDEEILEEDITSENFSTMSHPSTLKSTEETSSPEKNQELLINKENIDVQNKKLRKKLAQGRIKIQQNLWK